MNKNKHYRYCFECNKGLTQQEVNEVDGGTQPGEKDGKGWYCKYCRKDTGDQIQIFKCDKHEDIILKVGGTCERENKEKIFYQECPKCKQKEQQPIPTLPNQPKGAKPSTIFLGVGGVVLVLGAIGLMLYGIFKPEARRKKEPGEV